MDEEKQIGENICGFEGETIISVLAENAVEAMQQKHKEFIETHEQEGIGKRQLCWHMFTGPFVDKEDPTSIYKTAEGVEEAALANTALFYSIYCTRAMRNNFLLNLAKLKNDFKTSMKYGAINTALLMTDVGYELEKDKKLSEKTIEDTKMIAFLDKDADMKIITENLGKIYNNIRFYTEMRGVEYGVFTFDTVKKTLSEVYNTDGFEITADESNKIVKLIRRQD